MMISNNRRLAKNSIAGIVRAILVVPIFFFITPFMITKLGTTLYGVWSLGAVFTSFASISNLGLGTAIVKYVAKYSSPKNVDNIISVFNTVVFTFIVTGLLITCLTWVSVDYILANFIKLPTTLLIDAKFALMGISLIFSLNLIMGTFTCLLDGMQRMDLSSGVKIVSVLLQAFLTFIALQANYQLKGLVIANFSAVLLSGFYGYYLARKIFPELRIGIHYFNFQTLRESLKFSLQVQAAGLINLGFDPFNRIVITNLTSVNFLSVYDIANKIVQQMCSLATAAISPIMPASAEINVQGENYRTVINLHSHFLKLIYRFGFIAFVYSTVMMPHFIEIWLGYGFEDVTRTIQLLLMAWTFGILAIPSYSIMQGIGKPKYNIVNQLILVSLNIVTSLILGRILGYAGIIYSMMLSLFAAGLYNIVTFIVITRAKVKDLYIIEGGRLLIGSIVISLATAYLYEFLNLKSYLALIGFTMICALLFLCLLLFLREVLWSDVFLMMGVLKRKIDLIKQHVSPDY